MVRGGSRCPTTSFVVCCWSKVIVDGPYCMPTPEVSALNFRKALRKAICLSSCVSNRKRHQLTRKVMREPLGLPWIHLSEIWLRNQQSTIDQRRSDPARIYGARVRTASGKANLRPFTNSDKTFPPSSIKNVLTIHGARTSISMLDENVSSMAI